MCCICLSDEVELLLSCSCRASICLECFKNAISHSIGNGQLAKCNCGLVYNINAVCCALSKEEGEKYTNLTIEKDMDCIYTCGKCGEACDVTNYDYKNYFCPMCKENTCFKCKKDPHEGLCGNDLAEEKTEKFIINCCVPFYRGDACNKVTCPKCCIAYCWICKAKNVDYKHFVDEGDGCLLFGEREGKKKKKKEKIAPVVAPIIEPVPQQELQGLIDRMVERQAQMMQLVQANVAKTDVINPNGKQIGCIKILENGPRKGQLCNCPTCSTVGVCRECKVKKCVYIFKKGTRNGETCNGNTFAADRICSQCKRL